MKYMQDPAINQRLVAQKQRIAARLKQLDEVEMPRFQKHTGSNQWHKWTSRGLEGEWNTWVRTRAAVAKAKGVNYIEGMIRALKEAYDSQLNRQLAAQPGEENANLATLLGKIDAIEAEWIRYKPISWGNPF